MKRGEYRDMTVLGDSLRRRVLVQTDGRAAKTMRRASGECVCLICGKQYRQHPPSEDRDWNGDPFLNLLCNGDLVKL